MFLTQLRAILRASAFGPIKLLIPMMAHAFEVDQTLALIEQAKEQLRVREQKFDENIAIGAMIEIPAAALALPIFIKRLDFLSIGTNDLAQYTLAMDRLNATLATRLDALHPAVLQLIKRVASAGRAAGKPVAVCGGLASDLAAVPVLIGLGIDELSVVPALVPRLKALIRRLDAAACARLAREVVDLDDAGAVRDRLRHWIGEQLPPGESP